MVFIIFIIIIIFIILIMFVVVVVVVVVSQEGWMGLVKEIEMEVSRISKRNLGRDDR